MPAILLLVTLLCAIPSTLALRDQAVITNGATVAENAADLGAPSEIRRAKILLSGTKTIMEVRFSATQIFDVYQFRVRWSEPVDWADGLGYSAPETTDRRYELQCWVQTADGDERKMLFDRPVHWWFNAYTEKYRFPPELDLFVQCRVRAINADQVANEWRPTNRIRVHDVPVYLPGLEGLDVRKLTPADVRAVLGHIEKEMDEAPVSAASS